MIMVFLISFSSMDSMDVLINYNAVPYDAEESRLHYPNAVSVLDMCFGGHRRHMILCTRNGR